MGLFLEVPMLYGWGLGLRAVKSSGAELNSFALPDKL